MTRMHAAVDIELSTAAAAAFQLESVRIYNYNTAGLAVPDAADATKWNSSTWQAVAPSLPAAPGAVKGPLVYNNSAADKSLYKGEIYLFEAVNAGVAAHPDMVCMVVGGTYVSTGEAAFYRVDFSTVSGGNETFLDLLRNHKYTVTVKDVTGPGFGDADGAYESARVDIEVTVTDWHLGGEMVMDPEGQRYLWLSDLEFEADEAGDTFTMTIDTDAASWTARVSESDTDPAAGGASWLTVTPASGVAGTHTLAFNVDANPDMAPRTGYIHISGDNRVDAVVKVEQDFKFDLFNLIQTPLSKGYVGAFWRADQTGERLIKITRSFQDTPSSIDGTWTATVVEGRDWIVLDTDDSSDVNIYTDNAADMIANDAVYQVNSTLTSVSGDAGTTDDIYFHIGLTGTYTPTAAEPVRYGLILLTYNNDTKNHVIFVRHGEEADYLMRPEDATGNNSLTGDAQGVYRPLSKKFSPYNLTASGYRDNTTSNEFIQVGVNGGVWTNYPSQAGAYFQWASTIYTTYAWNPWSTYLGLWNDIYYPTTFWEALKATHETCPSGYRRPNDGSTSAAVEDGSATPAVNEFRQSLWLNPQIGTGTINLDNSLWGYYADGFFDRRPIVTSTGFSGTQANTAVVPGTVGVAYIGLLYYNPTSFASLFFPAAGSRVGDSGNLQYTGSNGNYWSASANNTLNAWHQRFSSTYAYQAHAGRIFAYSIRCVAE